MKKATRYKDYYLVFNKPTNRWFSFKKNGSKKNYVASAATLEGIKAKLKDNPKPLLHGKIPSDNNEPVIDPINLEDVNTCRKFNGFSPLEVKVRICLKCRKKFNSTVNRLCSHCKSLNENILDLGEYSVSI